MSAPAADDATGMEFLKRVMVLFTGLLIQLRRMPPEQRDVHLDGVIDALSSHWVDAAVTTPEQIAKYFEQLAAKAERIPT